MSINWKPEKQGVYTFHTRHDQEIKAEWKPDENGIWHWNFEKLNKSYKYKPEEMKKFFSDWS